MYDELIKNLRGRSQFLLPHYGEETSYDSDLMKQAADAIEELQKRVPKRPHGRLIDADALCKDGCGNCYGCPYDVCIIANAPTIIPAEEGE